MLPASSSGRVPLDADEKSSKSPRNVIIGRRSVLRPNTLRARQYISFTHAMRNCEILRHHPRNFFQCDCHPKRFLPLISPQASIFANRTESEVFFKPEQFDLIDTHVQFLHRVRKHPNVALLFFARVSSQICFVFLSTTSVSALLCFLKIIHFSPCHSVSFSCENNSIEWCLGSEWFEGGDQTLWNGIKCVVSAGLGIFKRFLNSPLKTKMRIFSDFVFRGLWDFLHKSFQFLGKFL